MSEKSYSLAARRRFDMIKAELHPMDWTEYVGVARQEPWPREGAERVLS